MELVIQKKVLADAVAKVVKAVDPRTVIPVLTGIKLEASEDNVMKLTASNTTISIAETVREEVEVKEAGAIVVPAKEFASLAKAMTDGEVHLKVEDNKIKIKAGKSKFNLHGTDASDFPKIKQEDVVSEFTVEADLLNDMIQKSVFAVSKVESRPALTGVNFETIDGELFVTATDSHRLSKTKYDVEVNMEQGFTVPAKGLQITSTLFKDGEVTVTNTLSNIVVQNDNTFVMMRLISGAYPDTKRLIPDNNNTVMTIDRTSFIQSLERSKILAGDDKTVTFVISNENKGIFDTIKLTQSTEIGVSEEEIVVNEIEGEELEISFNVDYVIEALKALDGDVVKFSFGTAIIPFTVVDVEDPNNLQLILPVRRY